jgi:hypothetical protein
MSTATSNTAPLVHAHELALRMRRQLVVKAAQHALGGARMVVLHEAHVAAECGVEGALAEAFEEEPARVAEDLGLQDEHIGQRCANHVHQ